MAAVVAVACSGNALAQSANIDLDIGIGDGSVGNGAPSSSFGAAAGVPGVWNRIHVGGPHDPVNLVGLDGNTMAAQMYATGGLGGGGGYNNHNVTGDYALLLSDYQSVGDEIDYHFLNFQPGHYLLYSYAVNPTGMVVQATVNVPGADVPIQTVTGPLTGNFFAQGITHSIHSLNLTGTSFDIDVSGPWPDTCIAGFQIVETPEPAALLALAAGLAAACLRRGKRI